MEHPVAVWKDGDIHMTYLGKIGEFFKKTRFRGLWTPPTKLCDAIKKTITEKCELVRPGSSDAYYPLENIIFEYYDLFYADYGLVRCLYEDSVDNEKPIELKDKYLYYTSRVLKRVKKEKYPKAAVEWIKSVNPNIWHPENGGVAVIPGMNDFKPDGYDPIKMTIYLYGVCEVEELSDKDTSDGSKIPDRSLERRPEGCTTIPGRMSECGHPHLDREDELVSSGYDIVVKWSCGYTYFRPSEA